MTITGDIIEYQPVPDGRGPQTVLIPDPLAPELSEDKMSIRQRDLLIDVRMERLVGWLRPGTVVGEADHEELVKTLSLIRTNRLDREGKL